VILTNEIIRRATVSITVILDVEFIEDDYAVLSFDSGEEISFPVYKLPKNLKEGDTLRFVISCVPTANEIDESVGGFQKTISRYTHWRSEN
jgi:hypothetical protein